MIVIHLTEYGSGPSLKPSKRAIKPGVGTGHGREPSIYVGVTSNRPGYEQPKQIQADMKSFEDKLNALGIKGVQGRLGFGAWAYRDDAGKLVIENEPTWVLRYKGNGKALDAIAHLGKDTNQDAVLVMSSTNRSDPEAAKRYVWNFNRPLDRGTISKVNDLAAKVGLGGWTIDYTKGKVITAGVKEWGDLNEHASQVANLNELMRGAGLRPHLSYGYVKTKVMERGKYENWFIK